MLAQTLGPVKDLVSVRKGSYMLGMAATVLSGVWHKSLVYSAAWLHLPCTCVVLRGQLAVELFSGQCPLLAWPLYQSSAHFPVTPLFFGVICGPWLWTLQHILLLSPTLLSSVPLSDFHSSLSALPWSHPTLGLPGTGPPV